MRAAHHAQHSPQVSLPMVGNPHNLRHSIVLETDGILLFCKPLRFFGLRGKKDVHDSGSGDGVSQVCRSGLCGGVIKSRVGSSRLGVRYG